MANINKIKREADNLLNSGYASMDARQILWERYASSFESRRDFDNVIGTYIRRKRRRAENASASTEKSNKIIQFPIKPLRPARLQVTRRETQRVLLRHLLAPLLRKRICFAIWS